MSKGKSRKNYVPNHVEKLEAPKSFLYELNMFRNAIDAHNLNWRNPSVQVIFDNVTLESLLLHARNLFDFFNGGATDKDDMRAFHFIKGKEFWQSSKLQYLKTVRPEINKHLSHLTYSRVSRKPRWKWRKIAQEIEEAYKEFLEALPDEDVPQWRADGSLCQ